MRMLSPLGACRAAPVRFTKPFDRINVRRKCKTSAGQGMHNLPLGLETTGDLVTFDSSGALL